MLCQGAGRSRRPDAGVIQIAGLDAFEASIADPGAVVGYAGPSDMFHGSVAENVSLGRPSVSPNRVRNALSTTDLLEVGLSLPAGLNTKLQTGGFPLTRNSRRV